MHVSKIRDQKYEGAVLNKIRRNSRNDRMTQEKKDINENVLVEDTVLDDDDTEDYVPLPDIKKKNDLVTLVVDRKRLAQETALTAKRHKIGVTAQ